MAVNRGCSLIFAGFVGVMGWCATVQGESSLTVEQNKLARMEQSLENRLVELEDVENEMLGYEYKLKRAQESLGQARTHYEQTLKELKAAEREHKQAPSTDTERALNKARHAHSMAERGVDSRNRRVEFIQSTFGDLETRMKSSQASVADIKVRVAQQQVLVDKLVKAMLVQAENQNRAQAKAASERKVVEPEEPVGKPEIPAPSVASLTPAEPVVESPEPAPEMAAPQAPAVDQREIDPELLAYARGEQERLEKVLSELEDEDDSGKQTFRNLSLRPSGGEAIDFEFLGRNQYRLVAPVSAGRQTYKINSWRFRRTIPAEDEGVRYVFIFDARRLSRPRLVMYPEYVLSQLD
ncbi:hypothetical protein [Microbulbifer pacificus]|uniref:Uncharacterized protein n=1 Tax=Microbulbifer pacificus TaxID=407164 RepID=A0AAU0MXY8_9GAMM|nr:hypothetical protein [Microbulbifer pacificus]WOX05364.1 hypothetical protein R5R33_16710 [Microbulbifer pacificus]